jgi:hypothetical protein
MGTMAIPDHTGHRSVDWRPEDPGSVTEAEALFRTLCEQRLVPFARTGLADFTQARRFDAAADEIMWVRPLQGG